jgi:hypothetical protein
MKLGSQFKALNGMPSLSWYAFSSHAKALPLFPRFAYASAMFVGPNQRWPGCPKVSRPNLRYPCQYSLCRPASAALRNQKMLDF